MTPADIPKNEERIYISDLAKYLGFSHGLLVRKARIARISRFFYRYDKIKRWWVSPYQACRLITWARAIQGQRWLEERRDWWADAEARRQEKRRSVLRKKNLIE